MQTATLPPVSRHCAKCSEISKRIRWDVDRDVVRGRSFDFSKNQSTRIGAALAPIVH